MTGTVRTLKNELNKIREEKMERDNKEVHTHHSIGSGVFLLRVKNRVGSWYERAKEATNIASIGMKPVLFNSLGDNTRVRIEM